MSYSFDNKSFIIDGKRVWLNIGEIHYFRFAQKEWRRVLSIARAAGINTVSTYIAWNYHEIEKGVFDFEGDKDFANFIDIAKELGMYVMVRPGPYICAEWAGGGIPSWTLSEEDIENRVDNKVFLDLTRKWFEQVMKFVLPRQVTHGGNIISVQNDNEYPGGWDTKSSLYILKIYNMLRELGVDVAITACNAHFKNGKFTVNYGCDGDWSSLYENIIVTYNTAGEASAIMPLKEFQPNKPTMVTELWTGRQVYWGRPLGDVKNITKNIVNFTALQSQVNLYMFQGGTNFGYYGSCDIATSYSSTYPVYEGGFPTKSYYQIKLTGIYNDTFGDLIADCDFEIINPQRIVQHTSCGDILYALSDSEQFKVEYNNKIFTINSDNHFTIVPFDFRFNNITIDYSDLCLLAKNENVLYMYGNAGESKIISINGIEQLVNIKYHDIVEINVDGTKIIVCDKYYAERLWILKDKVVLGSSLAYDMVINPCPLEEKVFEISEGKVNKKILSYKRDEKELPSLKDWEAKGAFNTIKFEEVSAPDSHHVFGANYGYLWYKAEIESDKEEQTNMIVSCYSNRIIVYVNGVFSGIFGDKRNGSAMRWDYQKPTDSFLERISISLKKGKNEIIFLSEDTGYSFDDLKPMGIMSDVYAKSELRLIQQPKYIGKTPINDKAREFLYSKFTYKSNDLNTIEFDLNLQEDETAFFVIHGHPCYIKVNGEDAPPVKLTNKLWQIFAHTVVWCTYIPNNTGTKNKVQIQYIGKTEDIIAKTRIYVVKKDSILKNWSVGKFENSIQFSGRKDFENIVIQESTLLVPSGDLSGFIADFEPKYYTTTFEGKDYGPIFLDIGNMKKGQIYLNGHNLGRFNGKIPQSRYYIPDAYLQQNNILTVFEEFGCPPQGVKLLKQFEPYER